MLRSNELSHIRYIRLLGIGNRICRHLLHGRSGVLLRLHILRILSTLHILHILHTFSILHILGRGIVGIIRVQILVQLLLQNRLVLDRYLCSEYSTWLKYGLFVWDCSGFLVSFLDRFLRLRPLRLFLPFVRLADARPIRFRMSSIFTLGVERFCFRDDLVDCGCFALITLRQSPDLQQQYDCVLG